MSGASQTKGRNSLAGKEVDRMRICMIASVPFPPQEGIGFYVWNLSHFLIKQGHSVQIITRGNFSQPFHQVVDQVTIWRPRFLPVYPLHVYLHSNFVNQITHSLEPQIDLIHLHTPLVKLPRTRLPTLVTVHTPMKADTASIPIKSVLGLLIKLQAPISFLHEYELFEHSNRLAAVSNCVATELGAYGIDPYQVAVLGNGVDTELFSPARTSQDGLGKYIFNAGRLAPRKGLEDLIQCAERVLDIYPELRLLIAGHGPMQRKLQAEIKHKKLGGKVVLLGHVSNRQQMVELYRGAVVYVHPAHYEGLPTALLEGMACGKPVVSTTIGGVMDVVKNGCNGMLTPPRSPDKLAEAIIKLLDNSAIRERLGSAAKETIRERLSWQVVGQKYLDLYQEILENEPC